MDHKVDEMLHRLTELGILTETMGKKRQAVTRDIDTTTMESFISFSLKWTGIANVV